jgi:superoxide dismutase, Fe-Mn family
MTATTVAEHTRHVRSRVAQPEASALDGSPEIGDLSRTVEHDIQILKENFAKQHGGDEHRETWENAWERLESAWETVKSELGSEAASSTPPREAALPATTLSAAVPPGFAASPPGRFAARVFGVVKHATYPIASATVTHARKGQQWLVASALAQARMWKSARPRVKRACNVARSELGDFIGTSGRFALASATRLRGALLQRQANGGKPIRVSKWSRITPSPVDSSVRISNRSRSARRDTNQSLEAVRPGAEPALESASEISRRHLVQSRPATVAEAGPFILPPLTWLAGALAPVISSRAIQVHHGCHHAACIALANRLARDHNELAGKSTLDIVRWAHENARDTELFVAASEAWNHAFFWQSLTPSKKRPGAQLCRLIDKAFGDFASFAHEFAAAGTAHVGSGWLWLVADRRNQVKILTTSGADSAEHNGNTCLLAIDLWEHAYYFDYQNRRRDYLDAVIDRRLDWDFAEARFRLALERSTTARHESQRKLAQNRGVHRKRQSEPPASPQQVEPSRPS